MVNTKGECEGIAIGDGNKDGEIVDGVNVNTVGDIVGVRVVVTATVGETVGTTVGDLAGALLGRAVGCIEITHDVASKAVEVTVSIALFNTATASSHLEASMIPSTSQLNRSLPAIKLENWFLTNVFSCEAKILQSA